MKLLASFLFAGTLMCNFANLSSDIEALYIQELQAYQNRTEIPAHVPEFRKKLAKEMDIVIKGFNIMLNRQEIKLNDLVARETFKPQLNFLYAMREHLVTFIDPQDPKPLQRAQKTVETFLSKFRALVSDGHISFQVLDAQKTFVSHMERMRQVKTWIDEAVEAR